MQLSAKEKKILNLIQEEIPLCPTPFKLMAKKIGIEEKELIQKIKEFKKKGILRGYFAGLNHRKLGFKSTLLALRVPENRLSPLVSYLKKHHQVTHCYLRKGEHNLWVVVIYRNQELKKILQRVEKEIGKENVVSLDTLKQFKLRTRLPL
jgi:DNA-binding Lrp family transcriptional regulator